MDIVAVGIGGFFGAMLRYIVGIWIPAVNGFPWGTLIINVLGCFFLGWFFTMTMKRWKINLHLKLAIGTGFIGAFTTFSTFSVETLYLLNNNQWLLALLYVSLSIVCGIGLAYLGVKLASNRERVEGEQQ